MPTFAQIVKSHRARQITWTVDSVDRVDQILRNAARETLARLKDIAGTGTLEERFKSALLRDMNRALDRLRDDYKDLMDVHLLGSSQIAADREAALAGKLFSGKDLEDMTVGLRPEFEREVKIDNIGTVNVTFGRVAERAVNIEFSRVYTDGLTLSERLWRLDSETRRAIEDKIVSAIAKGQSSRQLGRELKQYLTDAGKLNARYNATRLARTEVNTAHREAHVQSALDQHGNLKDYIQAIGWRLSASHPRPDICCRAGTLVRTANGLRRIEDVVIGDRVLTHTARWQQVTRLYRNTIPAGSLVRLRFRAGRSRILDLTVTPNHPVLTEQGWIPAGDLQMGSHALASLSGRPCYLRRSANDRHHTALRGFAGNGPSRREESTFSERCDGRRHCLHRITRRHLRGFRRPSGLRTSAFDSGHFQCYRPASEDCLIPVCLRTVVPETPQSAGIYQDGACRSSDCLNRPTMVGIRRSSTCCEHSWKERTPCHRLGTGRAGVYGGLDSRHRNRICGLSPRLSRRTSYRISDREAQLDSASHQPRTGDCRIAVPGIASVGGVRGRAAQALFRRTGNNASSYIKYNMLSGQCPAILLSVEAVSIQGEVVYNLGVANDNSYFANGIAVHNCDVWASQDLYGLGPGNYLPANVPVDHAHGLCYTASILKAYPQYQFVTKQPQVQE